jgi:glycosyltransferase involved in cell wall biosynthesis
MPHLVAIVHSYYDEDPRVRRAVSAATGAGWEVDVLALQRPADEPTDIVDGARIHRLPVQRRQGAGLFSYLIEYARFALAARSALRQIHVTSPVSVVHVNSVPDWLIFAATSLRRQAGVPILLDLHEASPEFFKMRFAAHDRSLATRLLARFAGGLVAWAERASVRAADWTLVTTPRMLTRLKREVPSRSASMQTLLNVPEVKRFRSGAFMARAWAEGGELRLVYAGALTPTYELDVVIRGLALLRSATPPINATLTIAGRGESEPVLKELAATLGVSSTVHFAGRVPMDDVPKLIAESDIALAPTRRDGFTDLTISNKVYEGMAIERVVVASRLATLDDLIPEDAAIRYESGSPASFADAIRRLHKDADLQLKTIQSARALIAGGANWESQSAAYLTLLERLSVEGRPKR